GVELIYILSRQAKRLFGSSRFLLKGTERVQHGRTVVPRHLFAPVGDIISELGADRNDLLWNCLELPEELPIFLLNPVEYILSVADQIHLVYDDGELAYTQERQEITMFLGLF